MNKTYTAIIVDDEILSRELINAMLKDHPYIEVVGEASNGEDAVVAINEKKPDIIFLDVQMPEMNGFQVLHNISTIHNPVVVFVTAFDHYAAKAFDANAIDYLLKPFNRQRFNVAMEKVRQDLDRKHNGSEVQLLKELLATYKNLVPAEERYISKVMIKETKKIFFINVSDIYSLEASGDYVTVQTEFKGYLVNDSLNEMERKLNPNSFVRIHRSTIVNMNYIKELHPYYNGEYFIVLKNNKQVKLSRSYKDVLKTHFDDRL